MRSKAFVGLVVEPPDGRILDRAVHAFDLAICPGMIEFGEPVLDIVLSAGQVKSMGSEGLVACEHRPNLRNAPAALGRTELKAAVREHGVDVKRHPFDESAQEIRGDPARRPFMQFRERELADPIDGDEQIQLALLSPDLREVDVDVPERIGLELSAGPYALRS